MRIRSASVSPRRARLLRITNDGTRRFCFDRENRLTGVAPASVDPCTAPSTLALGYDPLGRLQQTSAGATATQFLYDGDRPVAEYDGAGTLLRRYVHGAGVDEPLVWYEGASTSDRRHLAADNQGSVIAASGAGVTRYAYGPYGEPDTWAGGRFRYTGQIALSEVALYHYKARVYDPLLGRFLQTDPVGYQDQMNLYAYVGNDPVNATDPSGLTVYYGGVQLEVCLGVCVSIQLVRAHDTTTGTDTTLLTVGGGVGIGANGGGVVGVIGKPGDNTNIEHAKGTSVVASASLPGSAAGGAVGATKGADGRPIAEGSGGGGTGGASVTVSNTVTLDEAVDAVTTCFGFCGSSAGSNGAAPTTQVSKPQPGELPHKPADQSHPKSLRIK